MRLSVFTICFLLATCSMAQEGYRLAFQITGLKENAVLDRRNLFRRFQETLQYYHTQIYVFLTLCLILDIEPTEEEIELGMSELSVTLEDVQMAQEFVDRVKYSRMNQN